MNTYISNFKLPFVINFTKVYQENIGSVIYLCFLFSFLASLVESFGILFIFPILSDFGNQDFSKTFQISDIPIISNILQLFINIESIKFNGFQILAIIVCLFVFKGIFIFFALSFNAYLRSKLSYNLRINAYQAFIESEYNSINVKSSSYFANLLSEQNSRSLMGFYHLNLLFVHFFNFLVYFIFACSLSIELGSMGLLLGCLILIFFRRLSRLISDISRKTVTRTEELIKLIIGIFQNTKYLSATNQMNIFDNKFKSTSSIISKLQLKTWVFGSFTHSIKEPIAVISLSGIIILQVIFFKNDLASTFISLLFFYRSMTSSILIQNSMQNLLEFSGSIEALNSSIKQYQSRKLVNGSQIISDNSSTIKMEGLSFKYNENDAYALENINLEIEPFGTIAFVGQSGSGKSTLANIIAGLYRPSAGKISYGSVDYAKIDLLNFRNHIGYVTQENNIFDGTILDNITLFKKKEQNPEIEKTAFNTLKTVNLYEFVKSLPMNINTQVGENGVKLSGGQKQRIALARELFRNTPILILDEATSALDAKSEKFIQDSINALSGQKTIIVIAHRLSTIQNADKIIVLKNGKICETGNYEDLLLNANGEFRNLLNIHKQL